jgi:hypothetical protein
MHVFIDLGSHKLIIVPPSRPNDSSLMVAKISRLPSTKPHSSSQNHIRRVVHSQVWAVGLLPESFWDQNGHGLWVFLSHFPISHASWLLPMVFELLCRSLLREQCQNPWFPVEWRAEMSWKCWTGLNMEDQLPLVKFERMGATVPLFISENMTWCGLQLQ